MWGEQERQSKDGDSRPGDPGGDAAIATVDWVGFAHGVTDEYAVPAWWKLVPPS